MFGEHSAIGLRDSPPPRRQAPPERQQRPAPKRWPPQARRAAPHSIFPPNGPSAGTTRAPTTPCPTRAGGRGTAQVRGTCPGCPPTCPWASPLGPSLPSRQTPQTAVRLLQRQTGSTTWPGRGPGRAPASRRPLPAARTRTAWQRNLTTSRRANGPLAPRTHHPCPQTRREPCVDGTATGNTRRPLRSGPCERAMSLERRVYS